MILTPKQNSIHVKHFIVSLDGSPLPLPFFYIFLQVNKKQTLQKHPLYVIRFQQQLQNWSNRSSTTQHLWRKYYKVGQLGIYVKRISERIAYVFSSSP